MNIQANTKHTYGLFLISLGGMGVVLGGVCVAVGIPDGKLSLLGCGALMLLPAVWLVRSGLRVRNRAVAAGSTMHLEGGADGHTSHTEAAKPSFLKDDRPRPPRDNDF